MKFKYHKFNGFTLSEVMVCMAVISVIASLMVTTLSSVKPNKSKAMFKKTYMLTERIVDELLSDTTLYPNTGLHGFDNVIGVYADAAANDKYCEEHSSEDICQHKFESKTKFAGLFALKLNSLNSFNSSSCTEDPSFDEDPTAVSPDGVYWWLPCSNFTAGETMNLAYKRILIDINGRKKPDIEDSEALNDTCNIDVDRFIIYLRSDGYMRVNGVCARTYLNDVSMSNTASERLTNLQMGASEATSISIEEDGSDHTVANKDDVDNENVEDPGASSGDENNEGVEI